MCKMCKMDPQDVARMQQRQGAVEVDDFYKEVNYTPKKKNRPKRTRAGCPENNNKAHVYVWTTETNEPDLFSEYYGFHKFERKVCCGCGKRTLDAHWTEEYRNRFGKNVRFKYHSPEYNDEGFREYRKRHYDRNGLRSFEYWWI